MSKRNDFKNLFGCDESDEENLQTEVDHIDSTTMPKCNNNKKDENVHIENNEKKTVLNEKTMKRPADEEYLKRFKKHITQEEYKPNRNENTKVSYESNITDEPSDIGITHNSKTKERLKKTEIGELVVKLLTPAYIEKRFESRDAFKTLARNISHALYDKDEREIKDYVRNFLNKHEEFTSKTTL